MSTFVLVHGSWHDGSAWESVINHLEAEGHQAFAPTIAGHGKGVNKNVNHAQCTQSIIDYIFDKDLTDIVLLGHSFGGTIIAKVAEAIRDRIRLYRMRVHQSSTDCRKSSSAESRTTAQIKLSDRTLTTRI
jgi:pimeloyl-ACP methyl ester carboxylesterase